MEVKNIQEDAAKIVMTVPDQPQESEDMEFSEEEEKQEIPCKRIRNPAKLLEILRRKYGAGNFKIEVCTSELLPSNVDRS
jgi:hypothetical protein